ncbi:MAG: PhoX family phosphatase [Methyloligellaceae bacterium]
MRREKHTRAAATGCDERETLEETPSNRSGNLPIGELLARRFGRRDLLSGGLAAAAIAALTASRFPALGATGSKKEESAFAFREVGGDIPTRGDRLSPDHVSNIILRWGDPVTADAPAFNPERQSAAAQGKQFGYNNDYIAFFPLPRGSANSDHGLLCVNHEFTNEELMFPQTPRQRASTGFAGMNKRLVDIEMAAHGASIVEVRRTDSGAWEAVRDSRYNRRITATTPMRIAGPAAGDRRLRTSGDPTGKKVSGTINNCAGGQTPWGTYLMAEENINYYFLGELGPHHPERRNYERLGIPGKGQAWGRFYDRFDIGKEPNEANRFGWIVEVDPYDPRSRPVKRTALGRFKHEGCETIVNPRDGRLVIYMGDDQRFDYVYRYVSSEAVAGDDNDRKKGLLDRGILSVARFGEDGTLRWLPLVFGKGPLIRANGFHSQADVLIETRRAADLLGATPMDRPEDVQPNPHRSSVYVMLTNNSKRPPGGEDKANPRAPNLFGHILELKPPGGDHAADVFGWDPLLLCGPPDDPRAGATWHADTSRSEGWFAAPDNCAVDNQGRLWVASDQGGLAKRTGRTDGVWALDTEGGARRTAKRLYAAPPGAEVCGPCFTPDGETLFLAIQHPAAGVKSDPVSGKRVAATYDDPATRWPEEIDAPMPPRPAVIAIRRRSGGRVGG